MIGSMDLELKFGVTTQSTKELMKMARNKVWVTLNGMMGHHIWVSSRIMIFMVWASICGLIQEFLKETGSLIECTEKGLLLGLTVGDTLANISTIKSRVLESLFGQTVVAIVVSGLMAVSMVKELTFQAMVISSTVSGAKANGLDGLEEKEWFEIQK